MRTHSTLALFLSVPLLTSACALDEGAALELGETASEVVVPDTDFGGDGEVNVQVSHTSGALGVVQGARTGITYGVGYRVSSESRTQIAVRRLDGFGNPLPQYTDLAIGSYTHAWATAAAQVNGNWADDDIIAVGSTGNGGASNHHLVLAHFNKTGLSTAYDSNGVQLHNVDGSRPYEEGVAVTVWRQGLPDSRIYVAGRSCAHPDANGYRSCRGFVARFHLTSALDTSWGEAGGVTLFSAPAAGYTDEVRGLAVQSDGSVVVASKLSPVAAAAPDRKGTILVRRLGTSGREDLGFGGGDGLWRAFDAHANGIAIDPTNNDIIVAGSDEYDLKTKLWRLKSNGTPLATWGNLYGDGNGGFSYELGALERADAISVDVSGRIYLAGTEATHDLSVYRTLFARISKYGNLIDVGHFDFGGNYNLGRSLHVSSSGQATLGGQGVWGGQPRFTFARVEAL